MQHGLSKDQVTALIERLGSDAAFYKAFAQDPAAALQSAGLPTALAKCVNTNQLASMEQLKASSARFAAQLPVGAETSQNIFKL